MKYDIVKVIFFLFAITSCSNLKNNIYTTLDNKEFDYPFILNFRDSTFTAYVPDISGFSLDASLYFTSSGKYFIRQDSIFLISVISSNDILYEMENRQTPLGKLSDFVKQSTDNAIIPDDYIRISIDFSKSEYKYIHSQIKNASFTYTTKNTLKRTKLNFFDEIQEVLKFDENLQSNTIHFLLLKKTNNFVTVDIDIFVDRPLKFTLDLDDFHFNDILLSFDILMRGDVFGYNFYDLTGDTYIIKGKELIPCKENHLWHEKMKNIRLRKTSKKKIPAYYMF